MRAGTCPPPGRAIFSVVKASPARVLLFVADRPLQKTLTENLRQAGYLVDCCDSLETCQHVNAFYDHDIAFLQAEDDDLETLQMAASYVTPGARIIVVLHDPDPELIEQMEIHGIQVVPFPQDSVVLVELLQEEPGTD